VCRQILLEILLQYSIMLSRKMVALKLKLQSPRRRVIGSMHGKADQLDQMQAVAYRHLIC
jgi:hypothetical protein